MKNKARSLSILLAVLVLTLSACSRASVSRNSDGSLIVETTISQQELQDVINASIADPLITELNVTLQSGYVTVTGQRQRLNDASKTDSLSFRVDLGVSKGQVTALISNALLDNKPVEQSRVDHWNQTLASRLVNVGKKKPNSSLQSVNVTPDAVTMAWTVSK
jgi:hypothetical protein